MALTRRDLFKVSGLAVATTLVQNVEAKTLTNKDNPKIIYPKSDATRVVVCGAGFAGLTVAKNLMKFNPKLEVIAIDKKDIFVSCPYSNVWLGDADDVGLEDLSRDYFEVASKYNYRFVKSTITDIDRDNRVVITDSGAIEYDYVVLAGGIEYDYSNIFDSQAKANEAITKAPPAMMPIGEHIALKRELKNFKGGNFIIRVPKGVYRCPPAPYERACMVAYYMQKNGIKGKVIVLDSRLRPAAKPEAFLHTFRDLYSDIIEYKPSAEFKDIDFDNKYVVVEEFDKIELDYVIKKIPYAIANIIPEHKASNLATLANIKTDANGYAVLKSPTFESVSDSKVFVVGDAQGYAYPKSGQMASSCGYILAKCLAYKTLGKKFELYSETPANVCFSMVNDTEGVAVYHSVVFTKDNKIKITAQSTKVRSKDIGKGTKEWFEGIIGDILS
jgi:NADH dehydrogenase FAD-containing subunit